MANCLSKCAIPKYHISDIGLLSQTAGFCSKNSSGYQTFYAQHWRAWHHKRQKKETPNYNQVIDYLCNSCLLLDISDWILQLWNLGKFKTCKTPYELMISSFSNLNEMLDLQLCLTILISNRSIKSRKPINGYQKLMGIWHPVSQSMPFFHIIFHSLDHYIQQKESALKIQVGTRLLNHHSDKNIIKIGKNEVFQISIRLLTTYVIPTCYLIFLAGFFSYGLWENSLHTMNLSS